MTGQDDGGRDLPATRDSRQERPRSRWKLRFPKLFAVVAVLFLIDLIMPDFVPFIDEIILGALTLVLGALRDQVRDHARDGARDGEPPR